MNRRISSRKKKGNNSNIAYLSMLAIIVFALYIQTSSFDFVYCDDYGLVNSYSDNTDKISIFDDVIFKGYLEADYYRPIVNLSIWANVKLFGDSPSHLHLVNILLHLIFGIILFYVLQLISVEQKYSFYLTLFFSVHPLLVNSVAWIVGRNDILMGIFCLSSFYFFIKYLRSEKWISHYWTAHLILLFLGFLTKETAIIFPIILLSYQFMFFRENRFKKSVLINLLGWSTAFVIWFIMRSVAELGESVNRFGIEVFIGNLALIPEIAAKFFLPVNLSVLATYGIINTIAGIIFISIFTIIFIRNKVNISREALFGIIWFIVLIIPGMFITLKNSSDWNDYLETRSYLPVVGLLIMSYYLFMKNLFEKKSFFKWIFFGIVILFSALTFIESRNYRDALTFYESAVKDDPERVLFHHVLSRRYQAAGDYANAEKELIASAGLKPNGFKYKYDLGVFYLQRNNFVHAIQYFESATNIDSGRKEVYAMLGKAHIGSGDYKKAISIWRKAESKWQNYEVLHDNLAYVYLLTDELDNAIIYADKLIEKNTKAVQLSKDFVAYGDRIYNAGEIEKAVIAWRKALEIDRHNKVAKKRLSDYFSEK